MSAHYRRWVVDTNALISRLLLPSSLSAKAVDRALELGELLVSSETLSELADVLARPKFEKYISKDERLKFFEHLSRVAIHLEETHPIEACRDSKDDKFLSLAVGGNADALLTGDKDLRILHPFMGVPILSPREFLETYC